MKSRILFLLFVAGVVAVAGCDKPQSAGTAGIDLSGPTGAQPRLASLRLWLGPEQIKAEVAVTAKEVMTGMMFRTNTVENEGMLFVLGPPQRAHFWMKNCYVPLSVAYIDADGVIQDIHPLQPQNTNTVDSVSANVSFALETSQGWFDRHQIREGMTVRTERGSLMDTFRPQR